MSPMALVFEEWVHSWRCCFGVGVGYGIFGTLLARRDESMSTGLEGYAHLWYKTQLADS